MANQRQRPSRTEARHLRQPCVGRGRYAKSAMGAPRAEPFLVSPVHLMEYHTHAHHTPHLPPRRAVVEHGRHMGHLYTTPARRYLHAIRPPERCAPPGPVDQWGLGTHRGGRRAGAGQRRVRGRHRRCTGQPVRELHGRDQREEEGGWPAGPGGRHLVSDRRAAQRLLRWQPHRRAIAHRRVRGHLAHRRAALPTAALERQRLCRGAAAGHRGGERLRKYTKEAW